MIIQHTWQFTHDTCDEDSGQDSSYEDASGAGTKTLEREMHHLTSQRYVSNPPNPPPEWLPPSKVFSFSVPFHTANQTQTGARGEAARTAESGIKPQVCIPCQRRQGGQGDHFGEKRHFHHCQKNQKQNFQNVPNTPDNNPQGLVRNQQKSKNSPYFQNRRGKTRYFRQFYVFLARTS